MADQITLVGESRSDRGTRESRRLRRGGRVPAVVYGLDQDALALSIDGNEMMKLLHRAGHNALIKLEVDGDSQLTMPREVQRHPVKNEILHVDFIRIRADVALEANVPIRLEGEPAGAREGGVLEHVMFELTISAKPGEIPQELSLDVSELQVGENLKASDMALPDGVELITDPEAVVANVIVPRLAEEQVTLSAEQVAELEGLSQEELDALQALRAEAPEEAAEEAGEAGGGGEGAEEEGSGE